MKISLVDCLEGLFVHTTAVRRIGLSQPWTCAGRESKVPSKCSFMGKELAVSPHKEAGLAG